MGGSHDSSGMSTVWKEQVFLFSTHSDHQSKNYVRRSDICKHTHIRTDSLTHNYMNG